MFSSKNKKIYVYPCKPQFYYIKVGFKGGQNYIGMFSWWVVLITEFYCTFIEIIIWQFSYHTPYQPKTPISARGSKARGLIWVEGWYGVWHENCHIIIYLSYVFLSDKFASLISYAESKARPPNVPNVVLWAFCPDKKSRITHVTWWYCFFLSRKAVSPTWPIITPFALHKSDMCLKAVLVSHMQNEHIF